MLKSLGVIVATLKKYREEEQEALAAHVTGERLPHILVKFPHYRNGGKPVTIEEALERQRASKVAFTQARKRKLKLLKEMHRILDWYAGETPTTREYPAYPPNLEAPQ